MTTSSTHQADTPDEDDTTGDPLDRISLGHENCGISPADKTEIEDGG